MSEIKSYLVPVIQKAFKPIQVFGAGLAVAGILPEVAPGTIKPDLSMVSVGVGMVVVGALARRAISPRRPKV